MNETQAKFISLLKQESSTLTELHALLLVELEALKQRKTDSLTGLSEEKTEMLNKLGMLDKQRQIYTDNETHHDEINNEKTAYSKDIQFLNIQIQENLDKCKHQNNINGGIIQMSKLFNEKILDIIYGNIDNDATYNTEGRSTSNKGQHSLAHV